MQRPRSKRSRTVLLAGLLGMAAVVAGAADTSDSSALYQQRCAACHEQAADRIPSRQTLRSLTPESITAAMSTGAMKPHAAGLDETQMRSLALYLSEKPFAAASATSAASNVCTRPAGPFALKETDWNSWGRDLENTRFQPQPGLLAADVPRLKVKWVYKYPGRSAYGQPTLVGGRVFVTSSTGRVSALDAASGCELWAYEAGAGVKSPIVVAATNPGGQARHAAFFGDEKAFAHAVDAETGKPLWKTQLDAHTLARVTGPSNYFEGRLYVPLSSVEESAAGRDAHYPCCTFRGSVVALDANTGRVIWKAYAIEKPPAAFKKNSADTQMHGPAGAAIWSSPTIDRKRRLLYFATGNSYTDVEDEGSNSIQAVELDTGHRKWVTQATPKDSYLVYCNKGNAGAGNCPQTAGPDHDFGSPPLLRTLPNGKQILLASQKSGAVYGINPEDGKIIWQRQVGTGSALGGVQHGPAADSTHAYVAVSDIAARVNPRPGLTALRLEDGEPLWHMPTPAAKCQWGVARCARAQAAAVTAMPGVVFSGSLDGFIRAYAAHSGEIVWQHDTGQAYTTVDGSTASGGSIDFGGTTVADGVVYVNSGYGLWGSVGYVLIAFSVDG
jgi:polyvinyl alcohol dehydrogenase (cytochrome)